MLDVYEAWWDEVRPMMVNEDAPLLDFQPFPRAYNKQKEEDGIPNWTPPKL